MQYPLYSKAKLSVSTLLLFFLITLGAGVEARDIWKQYPVKYSSKERMQQAGWSNYVRKHAQNTYDDKYIGYYVGGGDAGTKHGRGRCPDQGTFGVDYSPRFTKVKLLWSHGVRYQDGRGAYGSDHKNHPFKNLKKFGSNEAH